MMLLCVRPALSSTLFFSLLIILSFSLTTCGNPHNHYKSQDDVLSTQVRNSNTTEVYKSVMILAGKRTKRKDPTNDFRFYTGGWNISSHHYWASLTSTCALMLVTAFAWFVMFGLCMLCICYCYCCFPREPYGYSRLAYALSLIVLILFTVASTYGCIVLYTSQDEFHRKTSDTLSYIVKQADTTVENLMNVSHYLVSAKGIIVDSTFLPSDVLSNIDNLQTKIKTSASSLADKTHSKSEEIHNLLRTVGIALLIVAAVILVYTFVGFLFSLLGLQCLICTVVIIGWILVTATFILCGAFLILHNVVTDSCVAMDEWVKNPKAHTALDEILPCIDNTVAEETSMRSKDVTYRIVSVVDGFIGNVINQDFQPDIGTLYNIHESAPKVPTLCNPFNSDYSNRKCASGEVDFRNATTVWNTYVCKEAALGECKTFGRLTPENYNQMATAVHVTSGLYQYMPFLVNLQDCSFVRKTFTNITKEYCPGLRFYSKRVYTGLVMVSVAVMLLIIFWVIYGRERRHRYYTKQFNHPL